MQGVLSRGRWPPVGPREPICVLSRFPALAPLLRFDLTELSGAPNPRPPTPTILSADRGNDGRLLQAVRLQFERRRTGRPGPAFFGQRGDGTRHEGEMPMRIQMAVASALVAFATAQAPPPPVLLEPLAGRQVFPLSNWWNQDISAAPIDARSDQLIAWISGSYHGRLDRRLPGSILTSGHRRTASPNSLCRRQPASGALSHSNTTHEARTPGSRAAGLPHSRCKPGRPGELHRRGRPRRWLIGDRHLLVIDCYCWLLLTRRLPTTCNAAPGRWDARSFFVIRFGDERAPPRGNGRRRTPPVSRFSLASRASTPG